jgi:hypothetical protein
MILINYVFIIILLIKKVKIKDSKKINFKKVGIVVN